MSLPRILVVKAGTAEPEVQALHGDYDVWFQEALLRGADRCEVVEAWRGDTLPRPESYGGLLITGSLASVRDESPWMYALGRWALSAADQGIPVLGVCFGHQLLGEALGGRVEKSPAGSEYGTVRVELTDAGRADPLFDGLDDAFDVQAAHEDAIVTAPRASRAVRLAGNAHTSWQALASGANVRAVQFHPEITAEILTTALQLRAHPEPVHDAPQSSRILDNWDRYWVRRTR